MARDLDTVQWRSEAIGVLGRVDTAAEQRFCRSTSVNKITMLAAADELQAATTDATVWLTSNPCPDLKLRERFAGWMFEHMRRGRIHCAAGRHRPRCEYESGD